MTVEFIEPPSSSGDDEQLDGGRSRLPRWVVLTLTLVAAAVVTGLAIKLARGHGHDRPTAAPQPSRITVHPGLEVPVGKGTCRATMPAAWRAAARAATTALSKSMNVFGITDDGSVLGVWQNRNTLSVRLADGTRPVRDVATFPRAGSNENLSVEVEGHTVLAAVSRPAAKHSYRLTRIVVIDARSGAQTPVPALGGAGRVEQAELLDGAVYWGQLKASGDSSLTVYRYDLSSRHTSVLFRGTDAVIERSAAGFGWRGADGLRLAVPARVPRKLLAEQGVSEDWTTLRTDGNSYAWSTPSYIGWWSKDAGIARFHVDNAYVIDVAGPLVFYTDSSGNVRWLDTRTGAIARQQLTSFTTSDGVLLTTGNPLETPVRADELMRLDTSTLPPLSC